MFENIMTHIDTILIIITLVGGYRLLKSDLTEIINQSHKGLKEEIKQCEGKIKECEEKIAVSEERLNKKLDDTITSIKELDKKTNEVSNKVSHIEGRLDQLFPPGVHKTAA